MTITKQDEWAQALLGAAKDAGLDELHDAIYDKLIGASGALTAAAVDAAVSAIANGREDEAMTALGLRGDDRAREQWWKFAGANLQACYGWGNADEADKYADMLNGDRTHNLYAPYALGEDDKAATDAARGGLVDITAEGVNLDDAIRGNYI